MKDQSIHVQIANELKQQIEIGMYPKNSPLPSENMLSSHYHVSRATIQKALNLLNNESYIYSVPGKGSFVKDRPKDRYELFFSELNLCNLPQKQKLIAVEIEKPTSELVYSLNVQPNKKVIHIKRSIYVDDKIAAYDSKYIKYFSGLPIVEVEINYSAFPSLLSNIVSPYEVKRELNITCTMAKGEIAEILELSDNEPCIAVEQRLYDTGMAPVGWGVVYVRFEYFNMNSNYPVQTTAFV